MCQFVITGQPPYRISLVAARSDLAHPSEVQLAVSIQHGVAVLTCNDGQDDLAENLARSPTRDRWGTNPLLHGGHTGVRDGEHTTVRSRALLEAHTGAIAVPFQPGQSGIHLCCFDFALLSEQLVVFLLQGETMVRPRGQQGQDGHRNAHDENVHSV